jgi:hypothetical protein
MQCPPDDIDPDPLVKSLFSGVNPSSALAA